MSTSLPFTVIGGYLGAGKTTLLNQLLTNAAGLRVAVLVNDFGSVNIDAELIRSHEGDTINLANGCLCCSLVNGFASVIGEIRKRAEDFDHMVIEASGVADPAKIAQYGQMYELPLDGIIVVVDAEQVRTQAANKYVGDTVVRQFGQADLIVLNKTDLVTAEQLASLRAWLRELAPRAPLVETVGAKVPIDLLLGAHEGRASASADAIESHDADHGHMYETWTIERAEPLSRQAIERFASGLGPDIYRAKGFVRLQDDPDRRHIFQQVGARWSLEPGAAWGDEPHRTRLVVIGRHGATHAGSLEALLEGRTLRPVTSIHARQAGALHCAPRSPAPDATTRISAHRKALR
jgi:G3E family GTPase